MTYNFRRSASDAHELGDRAVLVNIGHVEDDVSL